MKRLSASEGPAGSSTAERPVFSITSLSDVQHQLAAEHVVSFSNIDA